MTENKKQVEIQPFTPPETDGVVFGRYTFSHQLHNFGIPAKEMRASAVRFFKTRAMESHLVQNPWFALSVTPPRIYLNEDGFCKDYVAVNAYTACELYLITKMALEARMKKLKLQQETLQMWVFAHNTWLGQCYGEERPSPFTGQMEIKGSFVSNGAFAFQQLRDNLPVVTENKKKNPEKSAQEESIRADFNMMIADSLVNTFINYIAATEFYCSKLADIISMHTNKGLLTYSGDWKDKYNFAQSKLGTPWFYKNVKQYPQRYTTAGSITFVDFWVNVLNKDTQHARQCYTFMSQRKQIWAQINEGEVLHFSMVDCKEFHDFINKTYKFDEKSIEDAVKDQKRQDLEEKQRMVMKEVLKDLHSMTEGHVDPPAPLPLTRQSAHRGDGPLLPREQITGMSLSPPPPVDSEIASDVSSATQNTDLV